MFWELGNEYNYHPYKVWGDIAMRKGAQQHTAAAIRATDSVHPVATAHGEIPTEEVLAPTPTLTFGGKCNCQTNREAPIEEWEKAQISPLFFGSRRW